jgi:hypothetical protein
VSPNNGHSRRNPLDPAGYRHILGATFSQAEHRAVITIGNRSWSKWQLGRIGCPHPAAATRVARMMQQLGITTVQQFLERAHEFGSFKTMGVTCYWTVLALARDLGGTIEQVHGDARSFHAIHTRALKEAETPRRRKGRTKGQT